MADTLSKRIRDSRLLLGNQYAYVSDTGTYSVLLNGEVVEVHPTNQVSTSRLQLRNPYAHLDGDGQFTVAGQSLEAAAEGFRLMPANVAGTYSSFITNKRINVRHSNKEIERKARDLQKMMWLDKDLIWSGLAPTDPIAILDPARAFHLLGYDFDIAATLGQYFIEGKQVEVAGTIDDEAMQIRLSQQFAPEVRNFTAAHELGHALLHDARGLHRDRALDGATASRDPVEFEADKFAAYFLMPGKLVQACFKGLFGTTDFFLDEDTRFALSRGLNATSKLNCQSLRDLSRMLASAENYNGVHCHSLASRFRVSTEAMAIRLEELGLVAI